MIIFCPLWYHKYQIIIVSLLARFGFIRTCNHIMYRVCKNNCEYQTIIIMIWSRTICQSFVATSNIITWCLNDESDTDKVSCIIFSAYVVFTIKYEVLWINFIPQIYFSFFTFMIIWMKGARACTHIYAEKTATNIICFSYFTKVVRASNIYSVGTTILHKLFKDTR